MATHTDSLTQASEHDHGRGADKPQDIPARGWWDILVRVKAEMDQDNVSIIAAGLALYALLAVFPALGAAVSIYGLFASPADMANHLQQVATTLPPEGAQILQKQIADLSQHQDEAFGIGILIGVALALWSARKGMVALITATNVAYDEQEQRGFFKQLFVSLAFTIGAVLGFLAVLALGVAVPVGLSFLPLGPTAEIAVLSVRWIILFLVALLGLAVVYRYAPDRTHAQWRWITPGSLIAAFLWLAGSALFALYVRNWGSYGETYGALGGVVVLLMWLYLSGYVVILGAEINSEIERQTRHDTTEGQPKPLGQRGAYSADTVGPSSSWRRRSFDARRARETLGCVGSRSEDTEQTTHAHPEFIALLRSRNIALVVADTAGRWPLLEDVTADFMYLRTRRAIFPKLAMRRDRREVCAPVRHSYLECQLKDGFLDLSTSSAWYRCARRTRVAMPAHSSRLRRAPTRQKSAPIGSYFRAVSVSECSVRSAVAVLHAQRGPRQPRKVVACCEPVI